MVVKEDGTKWACQSCLKGHRVSGCTHTDRELTLVPKKGRPVTQCQHCRLERKKRSAHHRCDCGEAEKPHHSKEKCIHLREAEERAKAGLTDDHAPPPPSAAAMAAVADEQGCCCPHGGKCSCSLHRRDSELASDDCAAPHGPAVHKPRLESTRSDGSITVFANGHHKPVHRKNHAAHECGMPYKMPLPRAHTEQHLSSARRSVDTLGLDGSPSFVAPPFLPATGLTFAAARLSKSEQHSPQLAAVAPYGRLPDAGLSLDFTALGPAKLHRSFDSATSDTVMFPPFEPMSGVSESSYDPWSGFPESGVLPAGNHFGPWATQFEGGNLAQPALTAASSGTQSESDEIPPMDDVYSFGMPSIQEDAVPFGVNLTIGTGAPDSGNPNRRSLPPNFFGNTDFSMPLMEGEWQTPIAALRDMDDGGKMKYVGSGGDPTFDSDAWRTPTLQTISGLPTRIPAMPPMHGRPPSHSIGPGNVPGDDLMKQLFPGIDVSAAGFFGEAGGTGSSPQNILDSPALKRMSAAFAPSSVPTSTTTDPPHHSHLAFTTRPWDDGSISVPADAFNSPFQSLDQDFPTEWTVS